VTETKETKAGEASVVVSTRVPVEIATELGRLAAEGDRSVSREAARAIREHIHAHSGENGADGKGA
jgi:hypothetical protein